jgi:hypothetical protein
MIKVLPLKSAIKEEKGHMEEVNMETRISSLTQMAHTHTHTLPESTEAYTSTAIERKECVARRCL